MAIKKTDLEKMPELVGNPPEIKRKGKRGPKDSVIKGLFRRKPSLPAEEFATIFKGIRLDHSMSQKEFAQKVGVAPVHIYKIEKGELIPNAVTLAKILHAVPEGDFDMLFAEIARIYVRDLYECVKDSYDGIKQQRGEK